MIYTSIFRKTDVIAKETAVFHYDQTPKIYLLELCSQSCRQTCVNNLIKVFPGPTVTLFPSLAIANHSFKCMVPCSGNVCRAVH